MRLDVLGHTPESDIEWLDYTVRLKKPFQSANQRFPVVGPN